MTSIGDPLVGRVLDGRYEILSRLARGGMATVYRAQDRRLTRPVAVKVMHDGLGDDAEFARRFDREARAAAMLTNPHIVSVFDQGRDNGRPYIVMEYVEGSTLRHVISRERTLDPIRALDLLEPVVHALASAHEAGIVHRDIKPENVLISDRGQIKVADFGLARAITLADRHRHRGAAHGHGQLPAAGTGHHRLHRLPRRRLLHRASCCSSCSPARSRTPATCRSRSPTRTCTTTSRPPRPS